MQQIYSLFVAFIVKTLHKMQQIAILINAETNLPARRLSGGRSRYIKKGYKKDSYVYNFFQLSR